MFRCAFLFCAGLLSASAAPALTLDCALSPSAAAGGWVTERYVLQYDEATGKALAADAVTQYYLDGPVAAEVIEATSKKLVLSWRIKTTDADGQTVNMIFRASYFRSTGKVTVRAIPGGYSNDFEAQGNCRPI
jgi:activator of HSP90 ATPase